MVKHAGGLQVGDRVAVAGVNVGIVKGMQLREGAVEIAFLVDQKQRIYRDAWATVAWSGLLGTRYVDITMGTPQAGVLKPGDTLAMTEAYTPELLLDKMDGALSDVRNLLAEKAVESFKALPEKLDKALSSITALTDDARSPKSTIGKLLSSDEVYQKLTDATENMRLASEEVLRIAKNNSANIEKLITNISDAAPQVKETVASLNKIVSQAEQGKGALMKLLTDEKMGQEVEKVLSSLGDFAVQLEQGQGLLKRLATDQKLAADLAEGVESLKKVAVRLEQGEGSVGMFLKDEKAYKEFESLLAEVRDLVRSVKEQIPVGAFGSVISGAF
jgi:phospholipid/cholesterol/gamma-HCH transport system substrate-binding protein